MSTLAIQLENTIHTASQKVILLSDMDIKLTPTKWSKKEILGHLCDSGTINHKRFVDILTSKETITLTGYDQDSWVYAHNYQQSFSSNEILKLWEAINIQIIKLLTNVKTEQWQLPCRLEDQQEVTLEWLVTDYINHMNHHLAQIFTIRKK
ncbi:DinB family protein [Bacillus bingmayongensis]|uniref:DinB family protein n=1 Tax=Bacillus bingmayongensis TaxID=1150157 RepID=UPI001C8CF8F5|nr:DinB family protein [Bacillus bingmayongensis]MBY0598605.1 DinB family protein [Bacillus bingmayongensis]